MQFLPANVTPSCPTPRPYLLATNCPISHFGGFLFSGFWNTKALLPLPMPTRYAVKWGHDFFIPLLPQSTGFPASASEACISLCLKFFLTHWLFSSHSLKMTFLSHSIKKKKKKTHSPTISKLQEICTLNTSPWLHLCCSRNSSPPGPHEMTYF